MLTEQQISQYRAFGVVVLRNLLSPSELETVRQEFDHRAQVTHDSVPFDGTRTHSFSMLGDDTPFLASLHEDRRFLGPAEQLYGNDALAYLMRGYRYVGNTPWHYDDGSPAGPYAHGPKFQLPLQSVRADSGALRFVPGSHKLPWQKELGQIEPLGQCWLKTQAAKEFIDQVPAYVCEADPGDAVLFDKRIFHATWGGGVDRHACAVGYYAYPRTPAETEVMRHIAAGFFGSERFGSGPLDTQPWEDWTANAAGSRKRQGWIDRLRRLSELPEGQTGLRVVLEEGNSGKLVPV